MVIGGLHFVAVFRERQHRKDVRQVKNGFADFRETADGSRGVLRIALPAGRGWLYCPSCKRFARPYRTPAQPRGSVAGFVAEAGAEAEADKLIVRPPAAPRRPSSADGVADQKCARREIPPHEDLCRWSRVCCRARISGRRPPSADDGGAAQPAVGDQLCPRLNGTNPRRREPATLPEVERVVLYGRGSLCMTANIASPLPRQSDPENSPEPSRRLASRQSDFLTLPDIFAMLSRSRKTATKWRPRMTIKVGDALPDGKLSESTEYDDQAGCPINPHDLSVAEATKGKKIVIFALPGAYTPTARQARAELREDFDKLKAKKVDEIWCVAVTTPSLWPPGAATERPAARCACSVTAAPPGQGAPGLELDLTARNMACARRATRCWSITAS